MNKKLLNNEFLVNNDNKPNIKKILKNSTSAVCGAFEREVIVKDNMIKSKIETLKRSGYIIIGTGDAGFSRTKIWFNPAGVSL